GYGEVGDRLQGFPVIQRRAEDRSGTLQKRLADRLPFLPGDIASDRGGAYDLSLGVFHGGDADGDIDHRAVLADPFRLVVLDPLAIFYSAEDVGQLFRLTGGN